jgi:hypothetical protein
MDFLLRTPEPQAHKKAPHARSGAHKEDKKKRVLNAKSLHRPDLSQI